MLWDQALQDQLIVQGMNCSLIIIGVSNDRNPFCYDSSDFSVVELNRGELSLSLAFEISSTLNQLSQVHIIEFSFRYHGVLYYANCEFIKMESQQNAFIMKLLAPKRLMTLQSRRFHRVTLRDRLPVICQIIGLRQKDVQDSISFPAQIVEISGGSLSIITDVPLFYPIYMRFSFSLPNNNDDFIVSGEVVRVNPFGDGSYRAAIEFRNVPGHVESRIADYCNSIAK